MTTLKKIEDQEYGPLKSKIVLRYDKFEDHHVIMASLFIEGQSILPNYYYARTKDKEKAEKTLRTVKRWINEGDWGNLLRSHNFANKDDYYLL